MVIRKWIGSTRLVFFADQHGKKNWKTEETEETESTARLVEKYQYTSSEG